MVHATKEDANYEYDSAAAVAVGDDDGFLDDDTIDVEVEFYDADDYFSAADHYDVDNGKKDHNRHRLGEL